ncbi:unnamed protein product [Camellia sinensis]
MIDGEGINVLLFIIIHNSKSYYGDVRAAHPVKHGNYVILSIISHLDFQVHSRVRYLEKAVFNLDYGQLKLVFHALEERKQVIENAPHLCNALPCMTPCFNWFEAVYFWMGLKLYDLVAGPRLLHLSRYYSAQESVELFPTLARKGKDRALKGTVVYYDGQMNDLRVNVGLACSAALAGAAVLNHAEVISFLKDEGCDRINGAHIRDNLTGKEFDAYAKVVVNAAGSGVHIVLPGYYSPKGVGLIVPKTKDGCVVFMLPWLGRTVAGTTDSSTTITMLPEPNEDEIEFILDSICDYLNVKSGVMDTATAKHLSHAYGTLAERVAAIAQIQNVTFGEATCHGYLFLEAEVAYCARHENYESAIDFIARRSRLAFLDTDAAGQALPRIIQILAVEHNWDKSR